MFGPRTAVPYLVDPIGLADVPTSVCGEAAQAPVELLPLVRHVGDAHSEYEAWRRGDTFTFAEPEFIRPSAT